MTDTPVTTPDIHDVAHRHAKDCMAAFGREATKGLAGWKGGADPQGFIHEAIVAAIRGHAPTPS